MITKRLIYEPKERIESAITRLMEVATDEELSCERHRSKIYEVINRDLRQALEKLEYVSDLAT